MTPEIRNIGRRKLVGKRISMSLTDNRTFELWWSFMPGRKEISNCLTDELISMQKYGPAYFDEFSPANTFEKWAAVEVRDFENVPDDMETVTLPEGLYAVFHYKGPAGDGKIFQYIFGEWLPGSEYLLDNRPHFEVLGENYDNTNPESEEDIWIPVKLK